MDFSTVLFNNVYPTPFVNHPLLALLLLSLAQQRISPKISNAFNWEYDYIIVGAGSAGSVVANRLSEIPSARVLLLEAGKSPPLLTDVPAIWTYFWRTDIDWAYSTVPQKHTGKALFNRQVRWPRGKTLGGSSVMNGMLYSRCKKHNYDEWAAQGAVGWSASEVWPYFLKLEDNEDPEYIETGYHVRGGPQSVQRPKYVSEIDDPIKKATEQMGYDFIDANGLTQADFYDYQATIRDGQRCSTAKAYLVPAENRTNLDIITDAFVTQIVIENNRAVGIKFDHKNKTFLVRAYKEVIISAGSINTPQLLMLSGIGPKEHLEKFNIPVIKDLPVGDNLQDHMEVPLLFYVDPSIPTKTQKITDPINIKEYIESKKGPLTSPFQFKAVLERKRKMKHLGADSEFEIYFQEVTSDFLIPFGITEEVYNEVYAPYENETSFNCLSQNLQPKSRGTIRLQSSNPYDHPLIDPNYLGDPRDIDAIVEGLKVCHRVGTSAVVQEMLGSKRYEIPHPECKEFPIDDDRYYDCLTRSLPLTVYHPVGTAKMGSPDDPTTVVDPQLRVKGIKGLRVVDGSIMPTIPSGNTNAPIIMIAEKASDIIKATM